MKNNEIWLEAIVVDAAIEKMCVLVGGFKLEQPRNGRWSVGVFDGLAGKDFDFGVNEKAARQLYDTLSYLVAGAKGGRVLFNERSMDIYVTRPDEADEADELLLKYGSAEDVPDKDVDDNG